MKRLLEGCSLVALATLFGLAAPAWSAQAQQQARRGSLAATPIADIVRDISIPYDTFTLDNGLRVIVHTDRRASLVSVTVDYLVGASSEPAQRAGFAHLFEHLMFNGSENAPGDYSLWFQELGADLNGITTADRTTYYENTPTAGLERTLFLESDRMGYLLGAITQKTLDEQRGVVQNEKRQADDRPLARVRDHIRQAVYPAGHPYANTVFGSMADINNADLNDVRHWFKAHYGPGNAILTLAGDVDGPTARQLVQKYFGAIPAGPISFPPPAPVPMPTVRRDETMTDRIATPRLFRAWATPGRSDPESPALEVGIGVMAQSQSGYLKQQLVERERAFSNVSVQFDLADRGGLVLIEATVSEGVDPAAASARLDAALLEMLARGAAADDIDRYVTGLVSQKIRLIESGSGKVSLLSAAMRLSGAPNQYHVLFDRLAGQTPTTTAAAVRTWLGRPPYALTVLPGAAAPFEGVGAVAPSAAPEGRPEPIRAARAPMPPLGAFEDPVFPRVDYARLSNGIEVVYVQGSDAPLTTINMAFKVAQADGDPASGAVLPLLIGLFGEGSASRSAEEVSLERDRLGAMLNVDARGDQAVANLSALTPNLQPSLNLMAEMLMTPSLSDASLDRQRQASRAALEQARAEGGDLQAIMSRLTDGEAAADPAKLTDWSRDMIVAYHRAWIRPENATLYVASDKPLTDVQPMLERAFGQWRGHGPVGVAHPPSRGAPASPGVYLIDHVGSDQALISGSQLVSFNDDDQRLAATVANMALGDSFSSRLNMDLRETRGWSYGVQGQFEIRPGGARYVVSAPVQQDRAGDALLAIKTDISDFLNDAPLTQSEFNLAVDNQVRALSVSYSDGDAILHAVQENRRLGRPDDDQSGLAARYRRLTLDQARSAISAAIDPGRFVWLVVGDAATIMPQLQQLDLPVTRVSEAPQ